MTYLWNIVVTIGIDLEIITVNGIVTGVGKNIGTIVLVLFAVSLSAVSVTHGQLLS